MRPRQRALVGALLLAAGAATLWFAASQSEGDVRFVDQVLAAPGAHRDGSYTLLGVPEPSQVPLTGPNGTFLAANPDGANETRETVAWTQAGVRYYSTHVLRVAAGADGLLHWSFRNETRRLPTDPALAFPAVTAQWTWGAAGEAFPVVAFTSDGNVHADTPRLWAHYGKAPEHPIQPKPSQLTGHLLAALPDGTPLPDGAHIYEVTQFTAGCSSKFLPPTAQAKYASQGN